MALLEEMQSNSNTDDKDVSSTSLKENKQKPVSKKKFSNTVFAAKMRDRKNKEKLKNLNPEEVLTSCKGISVDVTRISPEVVPKVISEVDRKHRRKKKSQWKLGIMIKKKKQTNSVDKVQKERTDVIKNASEKNVSEKNIIKKDSVSENFATEGIFSEKDIAQKANASDKSGDKTQRNTLIKEKIVDKKESKSAENKVENERRSLRSDPFIISAEKMNAESSKNVDSVEIDSCRRTVPFVGKLNTKAARAAFAEKIISGETEPVERNEQTSSSLLNEKSSVLNTNQSEIETSEINKTGNNNKNFKNTNECKIKKHKSKRKNRNKIENSEEESIDKELDDSSEDIKTKEVESCSRTLPFKSNHPERMLTDKPGAPETPIILDGPSFSSEKSYSASNVEAKQCSVSDTQEEVVKMTRVDNASKKEISTSRRTQFSLNNDDENIVSSSKDNDEKLNFSNNVKSQIKASSIKKMNESDSSTVKHAKTPLNVSEKDMDVILNHSDKGIKESLAISSDKVKEVLTVETNKANTDSDSSTSTETAKIKNNIVTSMNIVDNKDDSEEWSCSRTRPYVPKLRVHNKRSLTDASFNVEDSSVTLGCSTDILHTSSLLESEKDKSFATDADKLIEQIKTIEGENIPVNQEESTNDSTVTLGSSTPKFDLPLNNGEWKFKRKRQMNSESDAQFEEGHVAKRMKKKSLPLSKATQKQSSSVPVSPSHTICSLLSTNCTQHPGDHHSSTSESKSSKLKEIVVVLTKLENMKDPLVSEYLVKSESACSNRKDLRLLQESKPDNNSEANLEKSPVSSLNEKTGTVDEKKSSEVQDEEMPLVQTKVCDESVLNNDSKLESPKRSRRTMSTDSTESNESVNLSCRRRKRIVHYIESDSEDDVSFGVQLRSRQSTGPQLRDRSKRSNVSNAERDEDDMEVAELSRRGSLRFRNQHSLNDNEDSDQEVSSVTYKMRSRICDEEHSDREFDSTIRVTRAKSRAAGIVMDDVLNKNVKERMRPKSVLEKKIGKPTLLARAKTPCLGLLNQELGKTSSVTDKINKDHQSNNVETVQEKEIPITEKKSTIESKIPLTSQGNKQSNDDKIGNNETCLSSTLTPTIKSNEENSSSLKSPCKTFVDVSPIRKSRSRNDGVTSNTPKKFLETPNQRDRSVSDSRSDTSTKSMKKLRTNLFGKIPLSESSLKSKKDATLKIPKVQLIRVEDIYADYQDLSANEFEILMTKYINHLMNSNFACDWRTSINYHRPTCSNIESIDNSDCVSDPGTQDDNPAIIEVTKDTENYTLPPATEKGIESPKKTPSKIDRPPESSSRIDLIESPQFHDLQKLLEPVVIMHEGDVLLEPNESIGCNNNLETPNQNDKTGAMQEGQKENQGENIDNDKQTQQCKKDSSTSSTVTSTKTNEKEKSLTKKPKKKMMKCSSSKQCSVCKLEFTSKDTLYDHLHNHSPKELQLAYKTIAHERNLDPGLIEDLDTLPELAKGNQNIRKIAESMCNSNRSSTDIEEVTVDDSNATNTATGQLVPNPANPVNYTMLEPGSVNGMTTSQTPIMICSCHAHETSGQDLQIEMVLLCKSCNIIFRRRDCFEVHFRTSSICRQKRQHNEITKTPKLFCSGCPSILNTLMDMRAHLEMHAKQNCQGTVTFVCNICKVAFFGVGGIFYSHWFNHTKTPNFVASKYSFPKLSVVSVLEDSNIAMTQNKSQEGFFYIAEHVCRQCKLPFSSEPDLQKHKSSPCQPSQQSSSRTEVPERNTQMIKLICDLCKKYYVNKEGFDRHCFERNHLKTPITKFSRVPVNETEQAIVCSLCRVMGKSIDEMKEHWKRVHSPIMELYTCKTCNVVPSNDVTNYTYDKFVRHCRLVHKSEVITCLVYFVTARYVCNICKFGFETEKSMKEHEVIHEKTHAPVSALNSLPPNINVPMVNTTLWVADKDVSSDGGRQIHPVYVQYPAVNGTVNVTLPQTTVALNSQNQQQMLNQSLNSSQGSTVGYVTMPHTNVIQVPNSNGPNHLLRNLLATTAFSQVPLQQQQQQQQTASRASPEMITLDSRSNSPVVNNEASVISNAAATSDKSAAEASAQRKSYMTMVNPDFETILGSNDNQSSGSNGNASTNKNKDSSTAASDTDAQSNTDSLAPQPFEVVLVTDEICDNTIDDTPVIERTAKSKKSSEGLVTLEQQQMQPTATPDSSNDGSSSTKSFLRVRSVAELQQIKIHLCSVCGLSFDTFQAFNQHQRVHDKDAGMPNVAAIEIGRDAPVQMIPPMQSNGIGNESSLLTQLRQKIMLSSNSQVSPNNMNVRTNTSVSTSQSQSQPQQQQPQQPQQPQQQQQQQQGYWFASCNGNSDTSQQPTVNYNTVNYTSVNRSQQQQQMTNVRRPVQSNTAMPPMNYSTRGPLPSHPNAAPSAMSPSRTGAIQLPERNAINTNTPAMKRPSGAATRIPQQSMLPSYETVMEQRHGGLRVPHNVTEDSVASSPLTSSRVLPNILSRSHQQQINQYHGKTYSRTQNDRPYVNSYNSTMNYTTQVQHQMQQQQQPQQLQSKVYSCEYPSCNFQSESFSVMRNHEKDHAIPINQLVQQQQQQQYQMQQQQQRLPVKHVSVCQMPERTRHAMPTSRSTTVSIQNLDKRIVCRLCNFYFSTNNELVEHNNILHAQQGTQVCCYVCDYCSRPQIFETEVQLREHMNMTHNFSCEFCKKRYPTREDLQSHTMDTHKTT